MFQFTPARGGRPCRKRGRCPYNCFNSRPRVAGDMVAGTTSRLRTSFQFTPARGGRRATQPCGERRSKFQFTPARGGRPNELSPRRE